MVIPQNWLKPVLMVSEGGHQPGVEKLIDETLIANNWYQLIDWEESKLIVSEPININN